MSRDDLRSLQPVDEASYDTLPLDDLAAYGMTVIEDIDERLTIENICVVLHRLFPKKFAMVGFPEHPDGMRINRTLLHMQPKYRNYATGSPNKGYALTQSGRRTALGIANYIICREELGEEKPIYKRDTHIADRPRSLSDDKIVERIRRSDLFEKYADGKFVGARGLEFLAVLDAYAHTPSKELKKRFDELETAARNVGDQQVVQFLRECENKFHSLLHQNRRKS